VGGNPAESHRAGGDWSEEMNEYIKKKLPPPFRASGRQLSYDGNDKAFCHLYSIEQVVEFAELIVRECAEVCSAQRDPANLNYKPSERFAEAVKQHFGVE
jgi:hypothetical protein